MAGKADFTEEEWKTILEAPPSAGLVVILSDRGGSIRETFSMAKAYTEARKQHGDSELLDEIAATKPEMDRARAGSPDELKQRSLDNVRQAISVLKKRSGPHEKFIRDYDLGPDGIHVGPPLTQFRGLLTGTPVQGGDHPEAFGSGGLK